MAGSRRLRACGRAVGAVEKAHRVRGRARPRRRCRSPRAQRAAEGADLRRGRATARASKGSGRPHARRGLGEGQACRRRPGPWCSRPRSGRRCRPPPGAGAAAFRGNCRRREGCASTPERVWPDQQRAVIDGIVLDAALEQGRRRRSSGSSSRKPTRSSPCGARSIRAPPPARAASTRQLSRSRARRPIGAEPAGIDDPDGRHGADAGRRASRRGARHGQDDGAGRRPCRRARRRAGTAATMAVGVGERLRPAASRRGSPCRPRASGLHHRAVQMVGRRHVDGLDAADRRRGPRRSRKPRRRARPHGRAPRDRGRRQRRADRRRPAMAGSVKSRATQPKPAMPQRTGRGITSAPAGRRERAAADRVAAQASRPRAASEARRIGGERAVFGARSAPTGKRTAMPLVRSLVERVAARSAARS